MPARLLGFAFANADFLFEMDDEGTILFAAGAANDLVQARAAKRWSASRPASCSSRRKASSSPPSPRR